MLTLHRILLRLALVVLVAGLAIIYLFMDKDSFASIDNFLLATAMGAAPSAVIAVLAWIVKPPA